MPQNPPSRQSAPAEVLSSLNMGLNLYTDPTLTSPKMWAAGVNVFSGMFGFIQRARFANVVTATTSGYTAQAVPFTTLKFFALPGLSNYLLGDNNGTLWSFDSGSAYAATQRLSPYVDPTGAGTSLLNGPWSREVLQNIVYEMNAQVKQSGRLANASTVEGWGLDTPNDSPQVIIAAGASRSITNIQRSNGVVTVTLGASLTVPNSAPFVVNVSISVGDTTFAGTFTLLTGNGTATLTWTQAGQNTSLLTPTGTVNTNVTKSVGRSYAWAWENANKPHVSAPSPSTQFIAYASQYGTINCVAQGTVAFSSVSFIITGTGTAFSPAWVGRHIWIDGETDVGRIVSITDSTHLTVATHPSGTGSGSNFQVFDPQATHIRLYYTADGGATYYRTQRNVWVPANPLALTGLQFTDTAASEPPGFPYTTETSQLYNIPPPIGAFVKEYQGSLIVYGVPGAAQTFFYSNQTLTSVGMSQESFAPLNQVTLPIQNASINGMVEFPGSLVIWSDKQDMFRLTGLLTDNTAATATQQGATIAALPYNLGCASPFAVALTPLGAIWLTSNAEVWVFTDKYAPRNIGHPIQSILKSITPSMLSQARMTYYHTYNRNWVALAVAANGATSNNTLLILDIDLLASNGSPSFFVFDMATNQAVWYQFTLACPALEVMYEIGGIVRMFTGATDLVQDVDYQRGVGTEITVSGGTITTHAWGNDHPFVIARPTWFRFNTNRDPGLLALDGWSFQVQGIDDDVYTFDVPLTLGLVPGVNDSLSLGGTAGLGSVGLPFRTSQEMFRVGGVNFVAGRRLRFTVNFPSAPGVDYQLRAIQLGFGATPPR